jgi:hypothetical protein
MHNKEIKLVLEFICQDVEQAEEFASEAFQCFKTEDEFPKMILSTILEDGVPIMDRSDSNLKQGN